jgi:transcriptional regulator with XRE-family HTH domain
MNGHIRKNYLRSHRKKLGLTQKELGFVLGLGSGCRISALETGRSKPRLYETITFDRLFGQPFEELWPGFSEKIEIDLDTRIRKLMDRLQRSQSGSSLRTKRVVFVLRNLETFLEQMPRE